MIYEIKTVDGVKTKVPLTGNGYGLPLGSIIAVYSNLVPDGYLPCNGAVYDTTTYAALYAYLGSNRLPDLRELVLVGAGQSDNDYDESTNPNGIHAHDVYNVGEFKDDQIQDIKGTVASFTGNPGLTTWNTGAFSNSSTTTTGGISGGGGVPNAGIKANFSASSVARAGTTTHGKQVGVNYCIKATPAYVEPDTVSDMVNTLRTQDSYSTEEVNTGKKWIDGKPIYRKVTQVFISGVLQSGISASGTTYTNSNKWTHNAETVILAQCQNKRGDGEQENIYGGTINGMFCIWQSDSQIALATPGSNGTVSVIFEYTKTTD